MKKHHFIRTALTILALAAISCNLQFVTPDPPPPPPPPPTMGPDPVDPGQPPTPNDGIGIPGGGSEDGQILLFSADRTTLNKGECTMLHWETQGGFGVNLNGQPVDRAGQQQICPPQTTVYGLGLDIGSQMLTREIAITVTGGNQPPPPTTVTPKKPGKNNPVDPPTVTPTSPFGIVQMRIVDVGISNIYPSANGHIMVTIQNYGNDTINGNTTLSCTGTITYKGKNGLPDETGQLGPYTQSFGYTLGAGEKFDQDTQMARNPDVKKLTVSCSITPPAMDRDKTNDSKGPVTVKDET